MVARNGQYKTLKEDEDIELGDEVYFIAHHKEVRTILSTFRRVDAPYHRVMIAGGGSVGGCLAERLQDDYSVKVIDRNLSHCEYLAQKHKITVLHGNVCDTDLLCNENIDSCDVFCAVTNDDEDNIISCMQAKQLGVQQVMALITRSAYVDMMHGGPINIAISPQQVMVGSILRYLRKGDVLNVCSLRGNMAEVMEVKVHGDKKTSKIVGRAVSQVKWPKHVSVAAIVRNNELIVVTDNFLIEDNDHLVVFVGDKKNVSDLGRLFQVTADYF